MQCLTLKNDKRSASVKKSQLQDCTAIVDRKQKRAAFSFSNTTSLHSEGSCGSGTIMTCNNSLLNSENDQRAWPRGLQNTAPALASTHHIRQLIK